MGLHGPSWAFMGLLASCGQPSIHSKCERPLAPKWQEKDETSHIVMNPATWTAWTAWTTWTAWTRSSSKLLESRLLVALVALQFHSLNLLISASPDSPLPPVAYADMQTFWTNSIPLCPWGSSHFVAWTLPVKQEERSESIGNRLVMSCLNSSHLFTCCVESTRTCIYLVLCG